MFPAYKRNVKTKIVEIQGFLDRYAATVGLSLRKTRHLRTMQKNLRDQFDRMTTAWSTMKGNVMDKDIVNKIDRWITDTKEEVNDALLGSEVFLEEKWTQVLGDTKDRIDPITCPDDTLGLTTPAKEPDLWFMGFNGCQDEKQTTLEEKSKGNTGQLSDGCLESDLVPALTPDPDEQARPDLPAKGAVDIPPLLERSFPGSGSGLLPKNIGDPQRVFRQYAASVAKKAARVKAIAAFPAPKDLTNLRSFMGLVNRVNDCNPDLKQAMVLWQSLLKKDNAFVWGNTHEAALTKVNYKP